VVAEPALVTTSDVVNTATVGWDSRRRRRRWRTDPNEWMADHGIEIYSKQREMNEVVAAHDRVAIRSCHSSGKSFDLANLAAWWLDVHKQGTARVVTTAPTGDQVRGILWVEINGVWERLGLPGRTNQSEIWFGSYQAAVGRKASDYNPTAMSGWHAENLLVLVDEADGVSEQLWGALDTLATNVGAKIVGIGNPDNPQSEFRKRMNDQPYGGTYQVVKISAWDTPNFTGELVSDTIHNALLSRAWVEEMRVKWGADPDRPDAVPDHPFWQSKVEAEYPDEAANAVIRLSDLVRARSSERDGRLAKVDERHATAVGVDVAGSDHGDESVVRGRKGLRLLDQFTTRTGDPEELEDWLIDRIDLLQAGSVAIDADGIGFGYVGAIRRRRGRQVSVTPIRSAASAFDPKQFKNRRAEMWWQLRQALAATGDQQLDWTVMDDDTAAQLLMVRYQTHKGKILVESKDGLRQRMGRSPDNADAVVYLYAKGGSAGTVRVGASRRHLVGRGR
jgi:hypothetical protein